MYCHPRNVTAAPPAADRSRAKVNDIPEAVQQDSGWLPQSHRGHSRAGGFSGGHSQWQDGKKDPQSLVCLLGAKEVLRAWAVLIMGFLAAPSQRDLPLRLTKPRAERRPRGHSAPVIVLLAVFYPFFLTHYRPHLYSSTLFLTLAKNKLSGNRKNNMEWHKNEGNTLLV